MLFQDTGTDNICQVMIVEIPLAERKKERELKKIKSTKHLSTFLCVHSPLLAGV